jgi:hypothetical protein
MPLDAFGMPLRRLEAAFSPQRSPASRLRPLDETLLRVWFCYKKLARTLAKRLKHNDNNSH